MTVGKAESKQGAAIYKALNLVQREICKQGIGKNQQNTFQNYKFRGIDDIYNTMSPILAEHGVLVIPEVTEHSIQEGRDKNDKITFHVICKVKYQFVHIDDQSQVDVIVFGESMDTGGDKATNKAMSAAFKLCAIQTFCIPTEGDNDSENASPEVVKKSSYAKQGAKAPTAEELSKGNAHTRLPTVDPDYTVKSEPFGAWNHVIRGADGVTSEQLRGINKSIFSLGPKWLAKVQEGDNMSLLSHEDLVAVEWCIKNPINGKGKKDPYESVKAIGEHLDS